MKSKAGVWLLVAVAFLAGCAPHTEGGRDSSALGVLPSDATFFLNDAQGTPIALADASGTIIEQRAHHALGASRTTEPARDAHGFVGNEFDNATSIADFNARPYRSETGIFLAPDPVAVFSPEKVIGDPRRAPAYAYSAGNPINLQDSNGEFFDIVVDVASIGYDLYSIVADNIVGNEDNLGTNLASLGADVVGAVVPFATGGGAAVRVAAHSDDVAKLALHTDDVKRVADVASAAQGAKLRTQLAAQEIAGGHAFEKHVLSKGEFPGVRTRADFASTIEDTMSNASQVRELSKGRTAYYKESTNVVVVRNPRAVDGGTAFSPTSGPEYIKGLK